MKGLFSIFLLLIMTMSGCDFSPICEVVEASRITSNDKVVDIVVTKVGCGATVPDATKLYIVRAKKQVDGQDVPIFVADNVKDLKVSWHGPQQVEISYSSARIFNFTNFWSGTINENTLYKVKISEVEAR